MTLSLPLKLRTTLSLELLDFVHAADVGDLGQSLAVLDLLIALYWGSDGGGRPLLRHDPDKPQWAERDYLVTPDGGLAPLRHVILKERGFRVKSLTADSIAFKQSMGVDTPYGVTGQALSIAYGLAQSLHMDRKSNRVYVLLTDEEALHGSTWEAAMALSHERLENVTALFSYTGSAKIQPLQDKWEAFGWKVFPLVDGHDFDEVTTALSKARSVARTPTILLAPTTFAKGIPFAEGKLVYRGARFSSQEMQVAHQSIARDEHSKTLSL